MKIFQRTKAYIDYLLNDTIFNKDFIIYIQALVVWNFSYRLLISFNYYDILLAVSIYILLDWYKEVFCINEIILNISEEEFKEFEDSFITKEGDDKD